VSKTFCNDNQCGTERCYTMRARAKALGSNIVVTNHALLQADMDMKGGNNGAIAEGLLGDFGALIVDEAHSLEQVFISGWTEEITGWDIINLTTAISAGMEKSTSVRDVPAGLQYQTENANDLVKEILEITQRFFELQYAGEEWNRLSVSLCEQRVVGGSPELLRAMSAFEVEMPKKVYRVRDTLKTVQEHLTEALKKAIEEDIKGVRREMGKGLRAAKQVSDFCGTLLEAARSKDGIPLRDENGNVIKGRDGRPLKSSAGVVTKFGVPHAVVLDGYESKDGTHRTKIRTVPLDVSGRASAMWQGRAAVLVSATLTDLTTGDFGYTAMSLGFPPYESLKTLSEFQYKKVQKVYVTPARESVVDTVDRAQYSTDVPWFSSPPRPSSRTAPTGFVSLQPTGNSRTRSWCRNLGSTSSPCSIDSRRTRARF
jgi:Rad3-related DNA helicase